MTVTTQIRESAESSIDEAARSFTRAKALETGTLVDAGLKAREAGFTRPVALTRPVWNCCVAWNVEDSARQVGQHETGRLWDVLHMAYSAACLNGGSVDRLFFPVYRVPRDGVSVTPREVALKMVVSPGDSGEAVITIMLPNEN